MSGEIYTYQTTPVGNLLGVDDGTEVQLNSPSFLMCENLKRKSTK